MEKILISKERLLSQMEKNRAEHRRQFEEALNGWKERVLEELGNAIVDAKAGRKFSTFINLPQPVDHTPEYDAIIDQVNWHLEDQIELSLREFNQFVRDDWGWKKDFMATNVFYSKTDQ